MERASAVSVRPEGWTLIPRPDFRCQLREKVLAEAASSFIIVADSRKDSKVLGTNWKQGVPIEVAPFAWAKVFQSKNSTVSVIE